MPIIMYSNGLILTYNEHRKAIIAWLLVEKHITYNNSKSP